MKHLFVDGLPEAPLAASALFHQHWLPHVEHVLGAGEDVAVILPAADHTHREWRRAATAMLARACAPLRINFVAGEGARVEATLAYLAAAPGVTGQYLET